MGNTYTRYPSTSSSAVPTYANFAALPGSANDGDLGITLDTHSLYAYNGTLSKWELIGDAGETVTTVGALDGRPASPNGASIGTNSIYFQSATSTAPGVVNSASQTFSGVKTFSSAPKFSSLTSNQVLTSGSTGAQIGTIQYTFSNAGSSIVQRDSNGNASFNNVIRTTTTVPTSGQTVTMSGGSSAVQKTIGSTTATFNLPDATTLITGWIFEFNNNSLGLITLNLHDTTTLVTTLIYGAYAKVICVDNSTTNGAWDYHFEAPPNAVWGIDGLQVTGSITALSATSSGPARLDGSNSLVVGSVSLTADVTGNLPLSQTQGSLSLTAQVQGNLPLSQTQGSLSLTTQVSGILPQSNMTGVLGSNTGDISIATFGSTPNSGGASIGAGQVLTLQPASATQPGGVSTGTQAFGGTKQFSTVTVGSVSFASSSTGGAAYSVVMPGAQGAAGTVLGNNGSGNLSWVIPLTNPFTQSGSLIVSSSSNTISEFILGQPGQILTVQSTSLRPAWSTPYVYNNLLINSGFDYAQSIGSNTSKISTTSGSNSFFYGHDCWLVNSLINSSGIVTWETFHAPSLPDSGGSGYVYVSTALSGVVGSPTIEVYQLLSNFESKSIYNKTVSFSINVKGLANTNQVGIQFVYNTSESKNILTPFGTEKTYTVNSASLSLCTFNAQTIGTAMTASGIIGIRIRLTGASSGNVYDQNNGMWLEQAMLNLGEIALPWKRRGDTADQELSYCQHFYEKSYDTSVTPGAAITAGATTFVTSGTSIWASNNYKTVKRSVGTVTFYATGNGTSGQYWDINDGAGVAANLQASGLKNNIMSGGATDQHIGAVQWTCDARI